jgi:dolichyl-diphosphooligosaccharide--protein glycosyltransferase
VGTALAIQVPVVGWTPIRSLEQMGPFLVFGGMQLIEFCEAMKRRKKLSVKETWKLRIAVFGGAAILAAIVAYFLANRGYFGPISSRVRGLFVKHTKTGNPLVDSVAEHQAAKPEAYFQYLHDVCYLAPVGFVMTALFFLNDSSSFLIVYGIAAYFFSHRMVRLILLTAPIASVLGGICIGRALSWALEAVIEVPQSLKLVEEKTAEKLDKNGPAAEATTKQEKKGSKDGKASKKEEEEEPKKRSKRNLLLPVVLAVRLSIAGYAVKYSVPKAKNFFETSHSIAKSISHPTIITKGRTRDGNVIIVDDYREAYFWLRDNTPEDARIMAWWDCKRRPVR